jgi:hypothetical protein
MSTMPARPQRDSGIPGLDDPTPPRGSREYPRHPLGLPAGSVRALLALAVVGLLWAMTLTAEDKLLPPLYFYLEALMVLILAHFFAAHGGSIAGRADARHPLFLPRGSVRLLLTAGLAGLVVWYGMHWANHPNLAALPFELPFVLFGLLGSFLLGYLVTRVVRALSGGQLPYWFQDIEAWLALICILGLGIGFAIHVFIVPSLDADSSFRTRIPELTAFTDPILAGVISFYFGSRS